MTDEIEAIRARHEKSAHHLSQTIAQRDTWMIQAYTDRATLLRLLDAARRSPLKSPAPLSKEPDMPVNTNDLRDMATEFWETAFTEMVIEAANQLDSTRTERNILRAKLDAAREELRTEIRWKSDMEMSTLREALLKHSWQEITGGQNLVTVDTAINAFRQWLADEGLVVVPREATDAMLAHGNMDNIAGCHMDEIWLSMIAAAPDVLGKP